LAAWRIAAFLLVIPAREPVPVAVDPVAPVPLVAVTAGAGAGGFMISEGLISNFWYRDNVVTSGLWVTASIVKVSPS
jgi:hypothetical protein